MAVVKSKPLHAGQARIWRDRARYSVVRCGRRYGKTEFGTALATWLPGGAFGQEKGLPVGWFAPTYKIFHDAWTRILAISRPAIKHLDQQGKRVEFLNGSVIEGWSLDTDDPARGRKYARVIIDEAGMVPNLGEVWRQAIQPTMLDFEDSDAWFFGTPKVIGKDFDDLFDRGMEGKDPEWRSFKGRTVDNKFLPNIARELQKLRATMPEWEYLQEYEGEPGVSDTSFFPREMLNRLLESTLQPLARGHIDVPIQNADRRDYLIQSGAGKAFKFTLAPDRGPWHIWCPLAPDADRVHRPPQNRHYVIGVDLGMGVGSSDTAFSVLDATTKTKAANFVASNVSPEEAARLACAAAKWFGGFNGCATVCPEANGGQGELFIRTCLKLGFQRLFSQRSNATERLPRTGLHYGWFSTNPAKENLLTEYRGALAEGRFLNLSRPALEQCFGYRYEVAGSKTRLVSDSDAGAGDDLTRMPHGDLVIADALAHYAALYTPSIRVPDPVKPWDSIGWRLEQEELQAAKEDLW